MVLSELARNLGGRTSGSSDPRIGRVTLDSRAVAPGDLFAALPGVRAHGLDFADRARAAGAAALLVEASDEARAAGVGLPLWVHDDAAEALGRAAAELVGSPSRAMPTIAITGTNGKTTVAWMAAELLRLAGRRPALLGTVGYHVEGAATEVASHTTPDAPRLQALLARHRDAGGDAVVLEASSHALEQRRLAGLDLDVAVFTNLTRDHLDYHGTFDAYRAAKARLFHALSDGGVAVLPAEGETADEFARIAVSRGARVIRYGTASSLGRHGSRVDLQATRPEVTPDGLSFSISGMGITDRSTPLSLSGLHNVENLLAATAAVLSTGADPAALQSGFASISLPPGRLERVGPEGLGFRCLVDYAHTPDALRATLSSLREEVDVTEGARLICVFGCGGDRDRGKRPEMGATVTGLADLAIVTSDNPRTEDPHSIIDDVLTGCRGGRAEVQVEADRRRAIRSALESARDGDIVLIAGKGHEDYQILPTGRIHFDDREVVRELIG